MSNKYVPGEIEPKWQAVWEERGLYKTQEDPDKPKWYALTMLPYPSGDLHTGHWYAYTPSDAGARFKRMHGYNVFFPIGFDAFGLNAENAAIKHGIHPKTWTYANMDRMRSQLRKMGAMWNWEHEAVSCDPDYYKWTQWFFRKFYDAGIAYREYAPVDWCPNCNTTLAREQVWGDDRHCERCGTPVIKKNLEQWKFRITRYADELLEGLETIQWPDRVKTMQTNWIGRSIGAEVAFHTEQGEPLVIFTTRPDTLWGATFMVLAPEHPLVDAVTTDAQRAAVAAYQAEAARMDEIQRGAADKEKTGVFTGGYATNPVNGERIPIWIADYVMMGYGTGAIMAVPAHDGRDFAFAQKYGMEIRRVITGPDGAAGPVDAAYDSKQDGVMINSGAFDGTPVAGAVAKVVEWLEANELGRGAVNYRLRDWLISRQRMWGAPIPIIYCPDCGTVPVPYADLPVLLPDDAEFKPTGESPLKYHAGFLKVKCPECGGDAERETDTMDTFMCSSWYHYAYVTPYWKTGEALRADDSPWDSEQGHYWLPVDQYTGGIEHATMHLLYTRFFTKALRDLGVVDFDEPMLRLFNQGMILGPDGEKMSKSRGNVINPDEFVEKYGADTVRGYLMFIGPWDMGGPWDMNAIEGVHRFLHRAWAVVTEDVRLEHPTMDPNVQPDPEQARALERKLHQTIIKVTEDMENFRFNTVIAALMELNNAMIRAKETTVANSPVWEHAIRNLQIMMAPIFPHIAEELWHRQGNTSSVHLQRWPEGDPDKAREEAITVVVQVNGKVRDKLVVAPGVEPAKLERQALALENVLKWMDGKPARRVIVVPDKLVNIVIG
ncbi:MAG: leucine--tRNA ligase [Caldilineaceae bacterium]|nr:leucine--tRNA ligase [Caldilineaceae bacterium]